MQDIDKNEIILKAVDQVINALCMCTDKELPAEDTFDFAMSSIHYLVSAIFSWFPESLYENIISIINDVIIDCSAKALTFIEQGKEGSND